jgi:dipeptidase E
MRYYEELRPDKDLHVLMSMGFQVHEIDVQRKTYAQLFQEAQKIDLWFVGGGNVFHLLKHVKESGLDRILQESKDLLYIGSSAGSMILGPSLLPVRGFEDDGVVLSSYEGLGFVDFTILPHYDKEKYKPSLARVLKEFAAQYSLIPLKDTQAIILEGGNVRLWESPADSDTA